MVPPLGLADEVELFYLLRPIDHGQI